MLCGLVFRWGDIQSMSFAPRNELPFALRLFWAIAWSVLSTISVLSEAMAQDDAERQIIGYMAEFTDLIDSKGNGGSLSPRLRAELSKEIEEKKPFLEKKMIGLQVGFQCKLGGWIGTENNKQYLNPIIRHMFNRTPVTLRLDKNAAIQQIEGVRIIGFKCSPFMLPDVVVIVPYHIASPDSRDTMSRNLEEGDRFSRFEAMAHSGRPFKLKAGGEDLYMEDEIKLSGTIEFAEITGPLSAVLSLHNAYQYALVKPK